MRNVQISRRAVLAGAAATVVAFDPAGIGWLTAADATPGRQVPDLDGELVVDEESRAEAADDYGHIAHHTPADVSAALLCPVPTDLIRQPFVRLPDSPVVFLLALLRAVSPPNDAEAQRLIEVNRKQYDQAVTVGGTHYPVGAIPLTPADWRAHHGDR